MPNGHIRRGRQSRSAGRCARRSVGGREPFANPLLPPRARTHRLRGSVILHGNSLAGVVGHERRRYQTYHRANGDIDRDCIPRMIGANNPVEARGCFF
jgi:hypothetical protein